MEGTTRALLVGALAVLCTQPVLSNEELGPTDGLWKNQSCRSMVLTPAISRKRIHAHSTVVFDITPEGRVENTRIKESDPTGILDARAQRAIKGWRYFAYIKDGVEAARKDVTATFSYGGNEEESPLTCLHTPWPEEASSEGNPSDPFNGIKHCYSPLVPMQMAKKRIAAHVDLTFNVSNEGKVNDIKISGPASEQTFDTNAIKALTRWRFHPFIIKGDPIERSDLTVRFYFGDKPEDTAVHKCQFASWDATNSFKVTNVYRKESDKQHTGAAGGLIRECCE